MASHYFVNKNIKLVLVHYHYQEGLAQEMGSTEKYIGLCNYTELTDNTDLAITDFSKKIRLVVFRAIIPWHLIFLGRPLIVLCHVNLPFR